MKNPFKHLDDGASKMISKPLEDRIRYIQRDRLILHSAIHSTLEVLDDLVRRPPSVRPPCVALVGDAGSGKTTLVQEHLRRHQTPEDPGTQRVVYCVADAYSEIRILQMALMRALGVPPLLSMSRQRWAADDIIQQALKERETRLVIVDEMKHLENLRRSDQRAAWDWIKWVSTANRLSVVTTGIPWFESAILELLSGNADFPPLSDPYELSLVRGLLDEYGEYGDGYIDRSLVSGRSRAMASCFPLSCLPLHRKRVAITPCFSATFPLDAAGVLKEDLWIQQNVLVGRRRFQKAPEPVSGRMTLMMSMPLATRKRGAGALMTPIVDFVCSGSLSVA